MLSCTNQIEIASARICKSSFDTTLPRFDLMAQLERAPEGLKMSELSQRMMVTGGNVTGITDGLEKEGLVVREVDSADRRVFRVKLTAEGAAAIPAHGRRARAMGHRSVRRADAETEEAAASTCWASSRRISTNVAAAEHDDAHDLRRRHSSRRSSSTADTSSGSRDGRVGVVTLNRPERKNPLTFESYAELRDLFRALVAVQRGSRHRHHRRRRKFLLRRRRARDHRPADAHGRRPGLLDFTHMTGDLVKAMRACPQPIVAAVDGVCAGAGAILAMASDFRLGTPRAKTAFLFTRVGLAGCDMGACAILPRIIGQGRASELLFTGRSMSAEEGLAWGFFNRLAAPETVLAESHGARRARSRRARRSRTP